MIYSIWRHMISLRVSTDWLLVRREHTSLCRLAHAGDLSRSPLCAGGGGSAACGARKPDLWTACPYWCRRPGSRDPHHEFMHYSSAHSGPFYQFTLLAWHEDRPQELSREGFRQALAPIFLTVLTALPSMKRSSTCLSRPIVFDNAKKIWWDVLAPSFLQYCRSGSVICPCVPKKPWRLRLSFRPQPQFTVCNAIRTFATIPVPSLWKTSGEPCATD